MVEGSKVKRQGWHGAVKDRWVATHPAPMKGYREIKCLLGVKQFPRICWQLCGLKCAQNCSRYGDSVCEGCPCMKLERSLNGG